MNKQLWQQAEALFERTLTLAEPARSEFIVTHTVDQHEFRNLVEVMLLAEKYETFMHSMPSVEVSEVLNNEAIQIFGHCYSRFQTKFLKHSPKSVVRLLKTQ